jgi:hypothetical protein
MYEEDEVLSTDLKDFVGRMMLSSVFHRLPSEFTYPQFGKSFKKSFKGLNETQVMDAFLSAIEVELIESVNEDQDNETYCFNGIALTSEEAN